MDTLTMTAFWRTIFFYLFLLVVMRIMGKREIGGLSPIDLAVTIIMAELAAIPIQNPELPLLAGIIPILTIMLLQLTLSGMTLKSANFRRFIAGTPSVIIRNGNLNPDEMKRARYTIADVLEQLRRTGYASPTDVEFAILETDGNLSVIPKSQRRPVTPEDLQVETKYEGLPTSLIHDGEVLYAQLSEIGLDYTWLMKELRKRGIQSTDDVFLAMLETDGNLLIQRKEDVNWYMDS